jgi:hypothetical protein
MDLTKAKFVASNEIPPDCVFCRACERKDRELDEQWERQEEREEAYYRYLQRRDYWLMAGPVGMGKRR